MLEEKQIVCSVCQGEFAFSAEEQTLYQEKGFSNPKKCQSCREAAKIKRRNRSKLQVVDSEAPEPTWFNSTCSSCGVATRVPFEPDSQKSIYCRECYRVSI